MTSTPPALDAGMLLGYARECTGSSTVRSPSLESQINDLIETGVEAARVYSDHTRPDTPGAPRPGLDALLDYARRGDTVVVVGVDRLGRTAREVLATVRDLVDRDIGVRALREGLTTTDDSGATLVGVLASLAVVNDEAGTAQRTQIRSPGHGGSLGRPRALSDDQVELAHRMRVNGDPVPTIAATLGVSRATLYRTLAEKRTTR